MTKNILKYLLLLAAVVPFMTLTACNDDDDIKEEHVKVNTNEIALNGEVFALKNAEIIGDSLFQCKDELGRNVQFVMRFSPFVTSGEAIGKKYLLSHHDGTIGLTPGEDDIIMTVNLLLGEYDSRFRLTGCSRLNIERTADYKLKIEILKGYFHRVPDGKTYLTDDIFVNNCRLEFNLNPLDPAAL